MTSEMEPPPDTSWVETVEIKDYSQAWFDRRERLWNEDAARLVASLAEYEECHPKGATCLMDALVAAQAAVAPAVSK